MERVEKLAQFSRAMRRDIVNLVYRAGSEGGHLGGCLSLTEILTVLYLEFLQFDPLKPNWSGRDRVILSKNHSSIALYAAMHQVGLLSDKDFELPLYGEKTFLFKHSKRNIKKGLEMSGGSLGQGLSFGLGIAIALQCTKNYSSKVYVILGDGECNEGSVWEAAALAGHLKQNNLVAIIDKNRLQLDGYTDEILNMENMSERWQSFGFKTVEIDGHNYSDLRKAFSVKVDKPVAIIANTVKGKGVSFAEDNVDWHDHVLTSELYLQAMGEIDTSISLC